jgi:hypothetical protein
LSVARHSNYSTGALGLMRTPSRKNRLTVKQILLGREPGVAPKVVVYAVGTILLCSAALYNGYPLVYWDSGSYLRAFIEWHNLPDRPIFYSIFLGLLHWRFSLWPIVIGQSLLTVFVIERTLAHAVPRAGAVFQISIFLLLTIATSLPWFTGQIMPYIFTPLLVLVIYLVAVERDSLARWEYLLLLLILCIAEATHYTHIALTLGLLILLGVISLVFKVMPLKNLAPVALSAALAATAIYAVNYVERREIVFGPYNSILLFDRLLGYRTAQEYLARACPTKHYEICPYLDELNKLPPEFGGFMWNSAGVLPKVGGAEHYRFEAQRLVHDIIVDAPVKNFWLAKGGTAQLLINFRTGLEFQSYGAETQINRIVTKYFAREADAYFHSKEYLGSLGFSTINRIHVPVGYISLGAVIALLFVAIMRRDARLATLLSMVIAILLGNAFICGGLSSGDSHYQSRLMPLLPLAAAIAIMRIWFDNADRRRVQFADDAIKPRETGLSFSQFSIVALACMPWLAIGTPRSASSLESGIRVPCRAR